MFGGDLTHNGTRTGVASSFKLHRKPITAVILRLLLHARIRAHERGSRLRPCPRDSGPRLLFLTVRWAPLINQLHFFRYSTRLFQPTDLPLFKAGGNPTETDGGYLPRHGGLFPATNQRCDPPKRSDPVTRVGPPSSVPSAVRSYSEGARGNMWSGDGDELLLCHQRMGVLSEYKEMNGTGGGMRRMKERL
ncbi:hypothetical protein GW17_00011075 [Ensete ventricosum]|nr:hypothetical protein GW17_00011075 [Ensete ventricosum]